AKAGGAHVEQKIGALQHVTSHAATAGLKTDARKPQTINNAKTQANDARTSTDDSIRTYSDRGDRVHGPQVYVPGLPGFMPPVFTDGQPKVPSHPVFADGGNGAPTGGLATPPGPDA